MDTLRQWVASAKVMQHQLRPYLTGANHLFIHIYLINIYSYIYNIYIYICIIGYLGHWKDKRSSDIWCKHLGLTFILRGLPYKRCLCPSCANKIHQLIPKPPTGGLTLTTAEVVPRARGLLKIVLSSPRQGLYADLVVSSKPSEHSWRTSTSFRPIFHGIHSSSSSSSSFTLNSRLDDARLILTSCFLCCALGHDWV